MVIHCHSLYTATVNKVVVFMPEGDRTRMGGTMRLGSRATLLRPGSRAFHLYGGEGVDALEVRNGRVRCTVCFRAAHTVEQ